MKKKSITFRTFRKYCCSKKIFMNHIDYETESVCVRWPNGATDGLDGGKCTEKKCPVWAKLRNI